MNDIATSDQQAATAATAPRVTLADIEAAISAQVFRRGSDCVGVDQWMTMSDADKQALGVLTICILVMRNGFTIVGKSAPASPENFNAELGCKFAREDTMRQVWAFEGYLLRDQLHRSPVMTGTV